MCAPRADPIVSDERRRSIVVGTVAAFSPYADFICFFVSTVQIRNPSPSHTANGSSPLPIGTIGECGGNPYPSLNPMVTSLHVGSVAALPRDLFLRKDGGGGGGGGLGMAFIPELSALRVNGTHVSATNVKAGAPTGFASQHAEIIVAFPAAAVAGNTAGGGSVQYGVTVLAVARNSTPAAHNTTSPCPDPFVPCIGYDRGGDDMQVYHDYTGTVTDCEALCSNNTACMAWSWCGVGSVGPGPRCCLKSAVPDEVGPFDHMACGINRRAAGHIPPGRSKPPFATENLLENTDGVGAPHHQCSLSGRHPAAF